MAYRLAEEGSGLALQKGWTSRALATPLTPLVVNGVVFALSSGEEAARPSPAVLYALDGGSGKELWNSGKSITAPARGGLSAGAGVVYVPATDSTLYAFGFPIDRYSRCRDPAGSIAHLDEKGAPADSGLAHQPKPVSLWPFRV